MTSDDPLSAAMKQATRFAKLWLGGEKVDTIAEELGVHRREVSAAAKVLSLPLRRNKRSPRMKLTRAQQREIMQLYEKGFSAARICRVKGWDKFNDAEVVRDFLRSQFGRLQNMGRTPDEEQWRKIAALYKRGFTLFRIGQDVGAQASVVQHALFRMGFDVPPVRYRSRVRFPKGHPLRIGNTDEATSKTGD